MPDQFAVGVLQKIFAYDFNRFSVFLSSFCWVQEVGSATYPLGGVAETERRHSKNVRPFIL